MIKNFGMGLCLISGWVILITINILPTTFLAVEPSPRTPETPRVPLVVEIPQNPTEPTEDTKEPTKRRPLKFKKFRVIVEITTEKSEDGSHVRKETDKFVNLAKSMGLTKSMGANGLKVVKLEGVSTREDKEQIFDINLD
jgi:hypothetical protein